MSRYIYPAVFEKDGNGYSISFPDIENCFTQGESLADGMDMAEDALCLVLYHMEQNGEVLPKASKPQDVCATENGFVTLVSCDTSEYEKFYKRKSVKKTLTIPEWLNDIATRNNINFSNVLQNALIEQLNIKESLNK